MGISLQTCNWNDKRRIKSGPVWWSLNHKCGAKSNFSIIDPPIPTLTSILKKHVKPLLRFHQSQHADEMFNNKECWLCVFIQSAIFSPSTHHKSFGCHKTVWCCKMSRFGFPLSAFSFFIFHKQHTAAAALPTNASFAIIYARANFPQINVHTHKLRLITITSHNSSKHYICLSLRHTTTGLFCKLRQIRMNLIATSLNTFKHHQ